MIRQVRQAQRLDAILERLSGDGNVDVGALANDLEVSAATIRRDLRVLEKRRLLSRTHGGAVGPGVLYELPLRYRSAHREEEKRRIATAAAERVPEGAAVGLSGGTTTTEVARALSERRALTVVTNALNIAWELAVRPNIKLVLTGGVVRGTSYELVGPLAEASLPLINLDIVFSGTDGISLEAGLTTHHEVEAHTNRALIARAVRTIVVADSTKIGIVAFARICEVSSIHELITDARVDPQTVRQFEDAGVAVSIV
jgi:DeoR family transcriptional regulator, aga operon transcriptional repressor